jgi:threonine/homoserine/homoserine lactone efflux protein
MPHITTLLAFALVSLGMVLTPGPNMIYLISRSITQGPAAGMVSLGGVALGFVFYMLCAAFGITALLFAVPYAYDALRLAGAAYLLWLAWQALRPNGGSPFQVKKLAVDGPRRLFAMGFVTNLLNPKIAMLYLALLPQFIDPAVGSVLTQSLALGAVQIVISVGVNALIALGLDRAVSRRAADLAQAAALADGHRARRPRRADRVGDAAELTMLCSCKAARRVYPPA